MPPLLPIVWVLILILTPMILIGLASRSPLLDKVGVVVLAFASGLIFAFVYHPSDIAVASELSAVKMQVAEICMALAIPLLLFSINIPASLKLAGNTVKVMLMACFSVCLASIITALLFEQHVDHIWDAAGMIVGSYTGGGQNIGAVKSAINADETLFIDILTYDIIISSLFLLSAMTVLKPIFSRFLPPFKASKDSLSLLLDRGSTLDLNNFSATAAPTTQSRFYDDFAHMADDSAQAFISLLQRNNLLQLISALILAAACIGVSVLLSMLVPNEMQSAITIICLTTLGAVLSFVPAIRRLTHSYRLGMFLIVLFCFTSGSLADSNVAAHLKPDLFYFIASTLVLSVALHALGCKLFKVDVDTFIITATAAIMSVPFIPMVTSSIRNKVLFFPGIAAAVVGYLVGNYLGIMMTYLLKIMLNG